MSFDVSLNDDQGNVLKLDGVHNLRGGVYNLNGSNECELNVTYNYSKYYYKCLSKEEGLRWLHGKKAKDTVKTLLHAVVRLNVVNLDYKKEGYWDSTERNAREALLDLLKLAYLRPEGVWSVE